jgi:acyl-CoA thioesterase-1
MQRVFLLGDSITGDVGGSWAHGYAELAAASLAGEALVSTPPENGEDSRKVLTRLEQWLGAGRYDLIHFNCGLHDIKRPHGADAIQVPIEEFAANLQEIVGRLRARAGIVIWARTTPVMDGQRVPTKPFDRFNRDVDAYNRVADRVMADLGVPSNDLHAAVLAAGIGRCLHSDGVHMTDEGNRVLAAQATAIIRRALAQPER